MDRNNLELFAQSYPKAPARSPMRRASPTRTPLGDVVSPTSQDRPRQSMSPADKSSTKKFLAIFLITILGAIVYSAFMYTLSDKITSGLNLNFFAETGQPGAVIMLIHSLIFLVLIYIILNTIKWC